LRESGVSGEWVSRRRTSWPPQQRRKEMKMPEELETGEDVTGAAGQNTGEETPAAGEEKMVPLAAVEDERKKRQDAEAELERERQYTRMAQIQHANQPQQPQQPQPQNIFEGIEDEEVVLGSDVKKILTKAVSGILQGVQHQNFSNQHTDYAQIVGTVDGQGRFIPAEPMQHLLNRKPELCQHFATTQNAHVFAYEMAKAEKEMMENEARVAAEKEKATQQKVNQATNPISTAAVGSGGAIDQAVVYAGDPSNWTPDQRAEFEKVNRDVKAGKYDK